MYMPWWKLTTEDVSHFFQLHQIFCRKIPPAKSTRFIRALVESDRSHPPAKRWTSLDLSMDASERVLINNVYHSGLYGFI